MDNRELMEQMLDPKMVRVIRIFLKDPKKQYYLREAAKDSGVPLSTTFRIMQKLLKLKIVRQIKISKFKVYQYEENEQTELISSLIAEKKEALLEFVEMARAVPGVRTIILTGEETREKANVLIIGERVDATLIKNAAMEIKGKHNFTVTYLPLTDDQFAQMTSMGLYSGKKKVLWQVSV